MKKILLVMALAFILPNASSAIADGHGKVARKYYKEREREDRKFYEKQEREERKFHEKQEKEAKKHREKMEREARKRDKERHRKDGKLPQDWRRRVEKGKHIDDDIFVQLEPVPRDIAVPLPPLPPGVSYKQIEGEIIKIDDTNRKILDVLKKTGLPLPPIPPIPHLR